MLFEETCVNTVLLSVFTKVRETSLIHLKIHLGLGLQLWEHFFPHVTHGGASFSPVIVLPLQSVFPMLNQQLCCFLVVAAAAGTSGTEGLWMTQSKHRRAGGHPISDGTLMGRDVAWK